MVFAAGTVADQYLLAILLSIVPTMFVYLRFHVRRSAKHDLLWDDWLIVVALVN